MVAFVKKKQLDNNCCNNYCVFMGNDMKYNLDDSPGFIMHRASLRYRCEMGRRLKAYDITTEQWAALCRLREQDGLSQKELADRIVKDQPNLTRILDKLEQKGLIRRMDNANDRRAFFVHLTPEGESLMEKLIPIAKEVSVDAFAGFTKEEAASLKNLLNRVWRNLEPEKP